VSSRIIDLLFVGITVTLAVLIQKPRWRARLGVREGANVRTASRWMFVMAALAALLGGSYEAYRIMETPNPYLTSARIVLVAGVIVAAIGTYRSMRGSGTSADGAHSRT